MAKKPIVTTVSSGFASNTQLNNNFTAIRDAFDNTLSLDGSTPNAMQADLDLNGNALLNVGTIDADQLSLNGQQVVSLASVPEWRSAWLTGTSYAKNDLVSEAGSAYICLVAHTSGTFSTDLSAGRWELFAQKGAAGAGTGDMLGANNLSDVANPATALSNIGAQAAFNTSGLLAQTSASTFAGRTITAGTGVAVTNGDGVSGNPTVAADLASQAEAQAGTNNTKLMTPLRVAEAVAALSSSSDTQIFTSSGTWTRPSGLTADSIVIVQLWGAGGAGARDPDRAGGGGGGGYIEVWLSGTAVGATETVTIGAGGVSRTTDGNGADGGNTSFGSLATAYGGAGGLSAGQGGGGGGVGAAATVQAGVNGGGDGGNIATVGESSFAGGAGGGGGNTAGAGSAGGDSVFGGAGGGGSSSGTNAASGIGYSLFGGNGGRGGNATNQPQGGSAPAGGGGGADSGSNSGAGGRGEARIYVIR